MSRSAGAVDAEVVGGEIAKGVETEADDVAVAAVEVALQLVYDRPARIAVEERARPVQGPVIVEERISLGSELSAPASGSCW